MKYDVDKALRAYHNVRAMLDGIPRELWYIFLPETLNGMPLLESRILAFRPRETDRNKVMNIQKTCNFPLRPNAPPREIAARLKILRIKKGLDDVSESDPDRDNAE